MTDGKTEVKDPKNFPKGKTTYLIGKIAREPELKTSNSGRSYLAFPMVIDTGVDGVPSTWWNCKIMLDYAEALPSGLLEKNRYMKVSGLGTHREGNNGKVFNDILITGVEMQNGEYIRSEKKEDAPF